MSGAQDENDIISGITGFSLNHVLSGLDLPSGPGLSNQLGISGLPSLNERELFNDRWDDPDAVGPGEGEDWEDEVDKELEEEESEDEAAVKQEAMSPGMFRPKEKKKRIRSQKGTNVLSLTSAPSPTPYSIFDFCCRI